jgi:hypothetical protein
LLRFPFNYYYYTTDKYIKAREYRIFIMPVVDPNLIGPSFAGGYYGEQTGSTGGGYDPVTGLQQSDSQNSTGGSAALSQNYNLGADFRGGYYGEQTAGTGGGYDPVTGTNTSDSTNSVGGSAAISQNYNIGMGGVVADYKSQEGEVNPADDAAIRLSATGLKQGGGTGEGSAATNVEFKDAAGAATASDWRVRLALANSSKIFYKDPKNVLLKPIAETNGLIFPYTPTINISHTATYNSQQLTHSNYAMQFYQGSDVSDITISGEFTVQDVAEGRYLMAAIYFLRASTKMFFGYDGATVDGNPGGNSGNPPPILYLNGYGDQYFPNVPCVLTSFSHILPNEVDYIDVPISESTTELVESTRPVAKDVTNTLVGGNYGTVQNVEYAPNWNLVGVAGNEAAAEKLAANNKAADTKSYTYNTTTTTRTTRLPTSSTISISLRPVYSRKSLHEKFNLNDFAAGRLVNGKGSFL